MTGKEGKVASKIPVSNEKYMHSAKIDEFYDFI
jgi:hypothetical protein